MSSLGDSFDQEKKDLVSDFNEAKLQIFRLNNRWESFSNKIRGGELEEANWELDDIYGELSTDAEYQDEGKNEGDTYNFKLRRLNELIAEHRMNPHKFYMILRMKERILRRLQEEAGKGGKKSSTDYEDDIDT